MDFLLLIGEGPWNKFQCQYKYTHPGLCRREDFGLLKTPVWVLKAFDKNTSRVICPATIPSIPPAERVGIRLLGSSLSYFRATVTKPGQPLLRPEARSG